MQALARFQDFLTKHQLPVPSYHIVLGSGFGTALEQFSWELVGDLLFADLGFHVSTVPDHAGRYRFYRKGKHSLCFQMGRLHGYEGHPPGSVVQTVMVPRLAGVKNFILTNASGGLGAGFHPGDVMLIRDHVNLTGSNPLLGANPKTPEGNEIGPRFPDLCKLYDREWRDKLRGHCKRTGLGVQEGIYLGVLGPSFETPAEVQLYAAWGMHAVGMSTVWEAIALSHSGARVAGLSLISNLGAGLSDVVLDHLTILETCRASASKIVTAIGNSIEEELAGK